MSLLKINALILLSALCLSSCKHKLEDTNSNPSQSSTSSSANNAQNGEPLPQVSPNSALIVSKGSFVSRGKERILLMAIPYHNGDYLCFADKTISSESSELPNGDLISYYRQKAVGLKTFTINPISFAEISEKREKDSGIFQLSRDDINDIWELASSTGNINIDYLTHDKLRKFKILVSKINSNSTERCSLGN